MTLSKLLLTLKGGAGSGNFGHSGRPGKIGGSSSKSYNSPNEQELSFLYKNYNRGCYTEDCEAIRHYTGSYGSGWRRIQQYLRYGEDSTEYMSESRKAQIQQGIKNLDRVFENAPKIPKNIEVTRSINRSVFEGLIQNSTFEEKGYVSTSLFGNYIGEPTSVDIKIRIPKGSKGIYLGNISDTNSEKELLLPRNSRFKIVEKMEDHAILELIE